MTHHHPFSATTDLSAFSFETLADDGQILLRRGRNAHTGESLLAMSPACDNPAPSTLAQLAQAYSMRGEFDASFVARPRELVRLAGQCLLLLEDPGGELPATRQGAPMEIAAFLHAALGITEALGRLHARGYVHKDIKPCHILLDSRSHQAWLLGLGLATCTPRDRPEADPPETISGTLAYMAPEQTGRMNRSVDARSDLYSLGVTFHEMLTGALPFSARNAREWVHCHVARNPEPPHHRRGEIPEALSAVVLKLLSKEPEDRYQTCAGLAADLHKCLAAWRALGRIDPFPLGAEDVPEQLRISELLYGREREIETLLAAFDRVVAHGAREFVLVSGYSGVGKSSLVNELHRRLVPPHGIFTSGKFDHLKRDIPYSTLAQAFQKLVRQILMQDEAEVRRWREDLRESLGPNGQLMVNLIPELEIILGPQPPVTELIPQDAQNRFQMVFRRFLGVFARPEHPLALFLDDLQWLDAATLHLLKHLLDHDDVRHVLLIGACRDNEIGPTHPLRRTWAEIEESGARIHQIALSPLNLDDVVRLVADTLGAEPEQVRSLAELVQDKTGGNPFFVDQFLTELAEEGLLTFDRAAVAWTWDVQRIRTKGYTDNVVDLMVRKLSRLPARTRETLQNFACLGNSAAISDLGMVCEVPEESLHRSLREALRLGLVSRTERIYAFAHDRVREAAYALIPEANRASKHLRLGRLLAAQATEDELAERVFHIVNHFNHGAKLITDAAEKEQLLRLNLAAGKKAQASIAHASATSYLRQAVKVLPTDAWERRYAQSFDLYLALSECEYLTGNFEVADAFFDFLLHRSTSDLDRARVLRLRLRLYFVVGKYGEGVEVALEALRLFGMNFPETDEEILAAIEAEHREVPRNLGGRAIADLVDAPAATDPTVKATINLLLEANICAYVARPLLFQWLILKAVNTSLRHGNTDESGYAYGLHALMLVFSGRDIPAGFAFSELSLTLNDKFENIRLRGFVLNLYGLVAGRRQPYAAALKVLRDAFTACLEVGDLVLSGVITLEAIWLAIEKGDALEDMLAMIQKAADFARQSHNASFLEIIQLDRQFVASLQGKTTALMTLDEGGFDEAASLETITRAASRSGIFNYHAIKQILAFLDGRYAESLAFAKQAEPMLAAAIPTSVDAHYDFFHALTLAALYAEMPADQQAVAARTLAAKTQKIGRLAETCPANFHNRHALLTAEIARIEGRHLEAMRGYDEAIRSARENGFVQNEALANESAARFHLGGGFETIAYAYLRDARDCYKRWGAAGKVRQLEEQYPRLRENASHVSTAEKVGLSVKQLDVESVVKASQALSMEIVLPTLIEGLMKIATEHAGAERSLLVLLRGGEPWIEARAGIVANAVEISLEATPADSSELPESILRYVIRTRESVILDDAATSHPFSMDAYIHRKRPRSVLCLPLIKQGRLTGVLYLENNLASHVFTAPRIAVLQFLASQAAISLENARLYADLERENVERKRAEAELAKALAVTLESKEQLRSLIDTMPAQCWMAGPDGAVEFHSRRWIEYTGLTPEEARGDGWAQILHPDDLKPVLDLWQEMRRDKKAAELEVRTRNRHGDYHWFLFLGAPLLNAQGEVLKWYGVNVDIDALKKAETLLAGEKRLFEMITNGEPLRDILGVLCDVVDELTEDDVMTSILLLDEDGKRLHFGAASSLPQGWTDVVEGGYIGPAEGSCGASAYLGEKVYVSDIATDPLWIKFRDRALSFSLRACWSSPIFSAGQRVLGTFAIYSDKARDITPEEERIMDQFSHLASIVIERSRADDALRKSEALMAEAQRMGRTGSWAWHLASGRLRWSDEQKRIFGFSPEDDLLTFDAFAERVHPEDKEGLMRELEEAVRAGRAFDTKFRIILPDGTIKFIEGSGLPIFGETGEPVEYIGPVMDFTERKRVEDELRRSEANLRKAHAELAHVTRLTTMGELTASIAHEVSQPLTGIVMGGNAALRWLREGSPNLEEARESIRCVIQEGKRAGDVIARIRKLFKKEELIKEPLRINDVVEDVLVLTRNKLQRHHIAAQVDLASGLPRVLGDRVQLQQVLMNLILNAVEAMEEIEAGNRMLSITTFPEDADAVSVEVRDSGPGIDPRNRELIFEAFQTTKPEGMGIGLAICRSIVQSHGGQLGLAAHEGAGAAFRFSLPIHSARD